MKLKLVIGLLFIYNSIVAQIPEKEIAKKHSFSTLGGYTENGISFLVTYNYHNQRKNLKHDNYLELSFLISLAEESISNYNISVDNYTFNPGYFFKIPMLSDQSKQYITTLGFGGIIGFESVNNNNTELENGAIITDQSKVIYGGFAGINLDIEFFKNWNLTAKSNIYYHPNSDVGNTKIFIGAGLKYIILENKKQ